MSQLKISDKMLLELFTKSSKGPWLIASDENHQFYIYQKDSSPIRYVIRHLPKMNNYDMRLMAAAKDLAEEVLENRLKQRKLF